MIRVILYPFPEWQKYLNLVIDPSFNAGLLFSDVSMLNPPHVGWLTLEDDLTGCHRKHLILVEVYQDLTFFIVNP